jgi:hypothetical protein
MECCFMNSGLLLRTKVIATALWVIASIALVSEAAAVSWNQPVVLRSSLTGLSDTESVLFAERTGSNVGRLHVVFIAPRTEGGFGVFYRRESSAGSSAFSSPIEVSSGVAGQFSQPDLFVDPLGNAHVVWRAVTTNPARQHLWTAQISSGGSQVGSPIRATPSDNGEAAFPQLVALRFTQNAPVRVIVAYVGRDTNTNQTDQEVLTVSRDIGQSTYTAPFKLTDDTVSGIAALDFDMVESLPPNSGSSNWVAQGALVFERESRIYAIMSIGASDSSVTFNTDGIIEITGSFVGQSPALRVQSVFGLATGYVCHLAFIGTENNLTQASYLQFGYLGESNAFAKSERFTSFQLPTSFSASFPSITVEPDTVQNTRYQKRVAISYVDINGMQVSRNAGGLSSNFSLQVVSGETQQNISPFTDSGTIAGMTYTSRGPGSLDTSRFSTSYYLRLIGNTTTEVHLYNEFGLPAPTPTPTATTATPTPTPSGTTATPSLTPSGTPTATATVSPSPSPTTGTPTASMSPTPQPTFPPTQSPTPSPTPTPSLTPSPIPTPSLSPTPLATPTPLPDFVDFNEVLDTLLGVLGSPSAERFADGDANNDGIWDCSDMLLLLFESD